MKPKEMLMTFSRYGLRKTSMEDIARSAGVSRQSIYKRFGSKEGAFEWVLTAFVEEIVEGTMQALKNANSKTPKQVVLNVFENWSGELVPVISTTAHGAEILESGMRFAAEAASDWEGNVMLKLSEFLVATKLAPSMDMALELANALNLASKGLMLKCQSKRDFSYEMNRIVQAVLRD